VISVRASGDNGDYSALPTENEPDFIEVLPGLARIAVGAWLRTAVWGLGATVRAGARLAQAATDPQSAYELMQGVRAGMRAYAREFLGVADLDDTVKQLTAGSGGSRFVAGTGPAAVARARRSRRRDGSGSGADVEPPELSLRIQGAELLRQSADVSVDDRTHPAYARILTELAPDEGRILRLLMAEGPQPVVDVRAANLIGVGSQLVEQGLNMIGPQSGVRRGDRVPAYLNNLQRLGLIAFSDDPLEDPIRYQVLEAQPEVLQAIKRTARAKTVQRSVRLTPFGRDFCEVVLPLDIEEIEALTAE
jgi:hypothetical protein